MQPAGSLCSIEQFCAELRRRDESAFQDTAPLEQFLRDHPVAPSTLSQYLNWDRQHYTRNLIDKTELYELIAICWELGQQSAIHNHHQQNCWMAAPIGKLVVQNYRAEFEDLQTGRCRLQPTSAIEMDASNPMAVNPREPVHKVLNPREFNQRAVSLHIYSRPFDRCVVYSEERGTCGEIKLGYTTQYGKRL